MNIPSLEFYVESISHLTSSVAVRRQFISVYEEILSKYKLYLKGDESYSYIVEDFYVNGVRKSLEKLRSKQKHEKRMLAYFVAQQRDILDYYKATEELYEETM